MIFIGPTVVDHNVNATLVADDPAQCRLSWFPSDSRRV